MTKTRLIVDRDDPAAYTANQETDVHTALCRGLAEYLETLSFVTPQGRDVSFKKVLDHWSDPNEITDYPSACVYSVEDGSYDASKMSPGSPSKYRIGPEGQDPAQYLVSDSEFDLDLTVEVYATDPEERQAVMMMLEKAFNPVLFMYGIRLEFPHYFNERATMTLLRSKYGDDELNATRGWRLATLTVNGRVPKTTVFTLPTMKPKAKVEVE